MPLEVSPAPFQMQLPYTPKFIPEALPPSVAGSAGPDAAAGSQIIPPYPGAVASPHRAIPALSDAGYTAPNIRAVALADAMHTADIGPYGPMSAGGSMYGGGGGGNRPMTTAPFPVYPPTGLPSHHPLSTIHSSGWESASLPAPRPPRLSRIEPSDHGYRHKSHDHADDASDASYYARPRASRHRTTSSVSSHEDTRPKEHHQRTGSRDHHHPSQGHHGPSHSQHAGGSYSPNSPSPLAGHDLEAHHPVTRSPLSPSRARQRRAEAFERAVEDDRDRSKRHHHAMRNDSTERRDRHSSLAPHGNRSDRRGDHYQRSESDGEEDRGRRHRRNSLIFKDVRKHDSHRDSGYESDRGDSRSRRHDQAEPHNESVHQRGGRHNFPNDHLEPPDLESLSISDRRRRPRSNSHSNTSSDGGVHRHSRDHHHQHHHHRDRERDHHTYAHPVYQGAPDIHPHAANVPYRRRALSMQFEYPAATNPHAQLGVGYQTPSVAGQGNADIYDDGASVAGSGMTFMDGPIGGRTSQYGLPMYPHHMKPDYRRYSPDKDTD